MPSQCAVGGCKNDYRHKDRWIIMPHVQTPFRLDKSQPQDYMKWERKLERGDGWKVGKDTVVCSNHFRYGRPLDHSSIPELYLRSYPDWARTVSEVHHIVRELPPDSCGTILQELCPSLHSEPASGIISDMLNSNPPFLPAHIIQEHKASHKSTSPDLLTNLSSHLDENVSRKILDRVMEHCLPGAMLGALVKHKLAPGTTFHSTGTPNVAVTPVASRKRKLPLASGSQAPKSRKRIPLSSAPQVPPSESPPMSASTTNRDSLETCQTYTISDFHSYSHQTSSQAPPPQHKQTCHRATSSMKSKKVCSKINCKPNRKIQHNLSSHMKHLLRKVSRQEADIHAEREKNHILNQQNPQLKKQLAEANARAQKNQHLTIDRIKYSDELMNLHTGLPTYAEFKYIYGIINEPASNMQYWRGDTKSATVKEYQRTNQPKPGRKRQLSIENELLMTLMRLRLNMTEGYLAFLFGVGESCVSHILSTWIVMLSQELAPLIYWPTSEEVAEDVPKCFNKFEGRVRAIIDCTEVPLQHPSLAEANTKTFSSYKNRTTAKYLIACSPHGTVSYVSVPAGGKMSDQTMVEKSGIAELFSPGDICMADKGFRIQHLLLEKGVELVIPPFTRQGKQFTTEKSRRNKEIANARIHIERVIGRMKDFKIFQGPLPITLTDLAGHIGVICGALVNLNGPVVPLH